MPAIYLDVCCLNRPFDDLTQERIHLEAEAILLILEYCQNGEWELLGSEAIEFEISQISDVGRRQRVFLSTSITRSRIAVSQDIADRAEVLQGYGFPSYDALHIACAEAGNADVLLTTNDQLLQQATRNSSLQVTLANPVLWLMEIVAAGDLSDEPDRD